MPRGREKKITETDIVNLFAESSRPVWTATDVADEFEVSRPTATNRLKELESQGTLTSIKVGGANAYYLSERNSPDDRTNPPQKGAENTQPVEDESYTDAVKRRTGEVLRGEQPDQAGETTERRGKPTQVEWEEMSFEEREEYINSIPLRERPLDFQLLDIGEILLSIALASTISSAIFLVGFPFIFEYVGVEGALAAIALVAIFFVVSVFTLFASFGTLVLLLLLNHLPRLPILRKTRFGNNWINENSYKVNIK